LILDKARDATDYERKPQPIIREPQWPSLLKSRRYRSRHPDRYFRPGRRDRRRLQARTNSRFSPDPPDPASLPYPHRSPCTQLNGRLEQQGEVLYFSYEMSPPELTNRLIIQATPKIRDGFHAPHGWSERDRPFIEVSRERISGLPLRINEKGSGDWISLEAEIRDNTQSFSDGRRPALVVVDHIGLIAPPTQALTRRYSTGLSADSKP